MEVYIPSGSPLMHYHPCRFCDDGWTNGDLSNRNLTAHGGDSGWYTTAQQTYVVLYFTGTGVRFDVEFDPPKMGAGGGAPGGGGGGGGSVPSAWTIGVKVNGTNAEDIGGKAQRTPLGIVGLPDGLHEVQVDFTRTDSDGPDEHWARVMGAIGTLSYDVQEGQTNNITVDDTQWAAGAINISAGWNMMEDGHSNFLNQTDLEAEQKMADSNHNRSLSWTDQPDASTTIRFEGSAFWVFGVTGGQAGIFDVLVDNQRVGEFDASGGPKVYNQVLYQASGLTEGPHDVTLVNKRGRLAFDYLVSTTGFVEASKVIKPVKTTTKPVMATLKTNSNPIPIPTTSQTTPTLAATKDAAKERDNTKVIIGASVGAIVGLLALTLLAFLIWAGCRRRREKNARHAPRNEWDEDKPWYRKAIGQEKGWKFIDLPDERVGSDLGHGGMSPEERKQHTHASGSSFGSSHAAFNNNQVATPPVAHTRRSLLPFKNNLWAKDKGASVEAPGPRPTSASPDPMLAALGGFTSPLTQLQRTCSIDNTHAASPGGAKASPLTVNTQYNNFSRPKADDGDELLEFEDMPQVGTAAWYHIFGLGTPAHSNRASSSSGFSNIFRRSHTPSVKPPAVVTSSSNAIRLDQRRPNPLPSPGALGPAAMATGAEERSPRRRFFAEKRQDVDSMWARY